MGVGRVLLRTSQAHDLFFALLQQFRLRSETHYYKTSVGGLFMLLQPCTNLPRYRTDQYASAPTEEARFAMFMRQCNILEYLHAMC